MARDAVCAIAVAALIGGLACALWGDALLLHKNRHLLLDPTSPPAVECCWVDLRILSSEPPTSTRLCARCGHDEALRDVVRAEGCDDLLVPLRGHPPYEEGGGLFVDVGADVGACTLLVAGQGFETHAFEPHPERLRASLLRMRSSARVHVHAVALEEEDGSRTLDEELPSSSGKPTNNILLMRLNAAEAAGAIRVLRGARRLLAAGAIAAIKVELLSSPPSSSALLEAHRTRRRELCQLLEAAGFTLHPQHPHAPAVSLVVCAHPMRGGDLYAIKKL